MNRGFNGNGFFLWDKEEEGLHEELLCQQCGHSFTGRLFMKLCPECYKESLNNINE